MRQGVHSSICQHLSCPGPDDRGVRCDMDAGLKEPEEVEVLSLV